VIRDSIVAFAKSLAGLSADPSGPRYEEYLDIIAPGETPERQREMAEMSGCALVVAGIWRAVGIDHGFQLVEAKEHRSSGLDERARVPGGPLGSPRAICYWFDVEAVAAFCGAGDA
jgi:hypothetical protein